MKNQGDVSVKHECAHCGDTCTDDTLRIDDHYFCCNGCQMVYQLLHEHDLQDYYRYEHTPGISLRQGRVEDLAFLDDPNLVSQLLDFQNEEINKVTLHLPQIHCSSCLYLLEHLHQLNSGVIKSTVNFTTKKASILFDSSLTSLKDLVSLLAQIGYEPRLNLDSLEKNGTATFDRSLLYKLGLAGFSFGNIMLLSFPEYLGFDKASYLFHIGYINISLATPVLLYSGRDYLRSAWQGLKMWHLNIDIPIAIGMLTLFGRSVYEILSHQGEGYLDSFSGFIFFLLIGKWFQSYTYQVLDFDRNYKSYFPISALVKVADEWVAKSLNALKVGDILLIKNEQLIPADGIVTKGKARIDYSFVTGEAELISKDIGDTIYAGGRHKGTTIEVATTKSVDQSYLTQLWNEDTFKEGTPSGTSRLVSYISQYFTFVVLLIAMITLGVWWYIDASQMFRVFTAVLIVACPCALALAIPFTYGNVVRMLAQHGLYLKSTDTIEYIQDVTHIIFDKTGTITDGSSIQVLFEGENPLMIDEEVLLHSVCHHSSHPLSRSICAYLSHRSMVDVDSYREYPGLGIEAECMGKMVRLGSSAFIFDADPIDKERGVFIEIDGHYRGHFTFSHALRAGIQEIITDLKKDYQLSVLSGDSDAERHRMLDLFGSDAKMYFNQSPKDKLTKVKDLQELGAKVMMIGDGLNDAGALKQSDVGVVISDQVNNFSPACDAILDGCHFSRLHTLLSYITKARWIVYGAFIMAFVYNVIGLSFAVVGALSPVIAAILMPLSSISVIVYGVLVSYALYRYKLR